MVLKLTLTSEQYPPLLGGVELLVDFDSHLQMFRAVNETLSIDILSFQLEELIDLVVSDIDYLVDLYLVQKIRIHESLKGAIANLESIIDVSRREDETSSDGLMRSLASHRL